MWCSKKNIRNIEQIREWSENSQMNSKHGAGIFKGHRLICKSFNQHRSIFSNNVMCSFHAEIQCLHLLINTYKKSYNMDIDKIRRKMKKIKIITCRNDLSYDSTPCYDCIFQIKNLGIRNIIYVDQNIIYNKKINEIYNRKTSVTTRLDKHIKIRNLIKHI